VARDDPLAGIDVEGPVLVEVFVLCLRAGVIALTGPCGAAPWYIEKAAGEHPVDVVRRLVADVIGEPELVHSTSWRQSEDGVILSFFVVVDPDVVDTMGYAPRHAGRARPFGRYRGAGGDRHRPGAGARHPPPGLVGTRRRGGAGQAVG